MFTRRRYNNNKRAPAYRCAACVLHSFILSHSTFSFRRGFLRLEMARGERPSLWEAHKHRVRANVETLPPELWMRVFEFATRGPVGRWSAISISHVSRHFRSIILNVPKIWSTIDGTQSREHSDAFVARSKQSVLSVTIDEYEDETDITTAVLQNLHRIGRLKCYIEDPRRGCQILSRLAEQGSSSHPIHVPQLSFLDLWVASYPVNDTSIHFSAPCLRILHIKNIVPQISSNSLRLLTYEVLAYTEYEPSAKAWSADPFFNLLQNLPALDRLEIRLASTSISDVVSGRPTIFTRSMRLVLDNDNLGPIASILTVPTYPHLKRLALETLSGDPCPVLRAFPTSRCPQLDCVKVSFGDIGDHFRAVGTQTILRCFPQIRHLDLHGGNFTLQNGMNPTLPSLHTLALTRSLNISNAFPLARHLASRQLRHLILVDEYSTQHERDNRTITDLQALLGDRLVLQSLVGWWQDARNLWMGRRNSYL